MNDRRDPASMNDAGWADRPRNQRTIRIVLYVVCAVLLLFELLVHRHSYNAIEGIPFFYALYAFAALWIAVAIAKGLRRVVKRDEDVYRDR